MASVTTSQLSSDLDFANNDFQVTLTTVTPTSSVGVEFTASQEALRERYEVEVNGREQMVDQRFFININGVSTYPSKGWVLTAGSRSYKVWESSIGNGGVLLTITCISRYQGES